MPGTLVSDPDMHHGTCLTYVPWCMPGSLTSGFLWNRRRGKRSPHSRRMRNPQFCVSGKRPMQCIAVLVIELGTNFGLKNDVPCLISIPTPHPDPYSRSNLYIKGILITMACYSMTPVYIAYVWLFLNRKSWHLPIPVSSLTACVRLQNLSWYKTGLVSRQYLLSKLQNWILSKTGQYKTCLVSNTKIEASIRATKPKPWQSHLTSETVEIFIQNEKAGLMPMQSRFLVRQVERRHKAGFGAAGLGTEKSWFWNRHKADFGAVGLGSAQSRFWNNHKAGFGAVGLGSAQSRFWSRHKAGLGAAGYKPV